MNVKKILLTVSATALLCCLLTACGSSVPSGEKIPTGADAGDATSSTVGQGASQTTKGETHSAVVVVSSGDGFFDDDSDESTGSTTSGKRTTSASGAPAVTTSANNPATTQSTRSDGSATSKTTQIPSTDESGVPWITVPLPTK